MSTTRKYLNAEDVYDWQLAQDMAKKAAEMKAEIRSRLKATIDKQGTGDFDFDDLRAYLFKAERITTAWRTVVDVMLDDNPELAERVSELITENSKPSFTYDIR